MSSSAGTPPSGSEDPPRTWVEATHRDGADRRGDCGGRRRRAGCSSSPVAATWSSPTRASPARVVKVATRGAGRRRRSRTPARPAPGSPVTVAAGEGWDDVVEGAAERGWVGVEALSGIPGSRRCHPDPERRRLRPGGRPRPSPGCGCWDRKLKGVRTFANADCGFGYRTSRFKADPGRHVVLDVTFQFRRATLSAPVRYAELAARLGVEQGERAPLRGCPRSRARAAARQGHGPRPGRPRHLERRLLLHQPDRRRGRRPRGCTRLAQPGRQREDQRRLADRARRLREGLRPGPRRRRVGLSTKHTLALTNRGSATTEELLALAREVRDGVEQRFGIRLVNEPVLVGCEL